MELAKRATPVSFRAALRHESICTTLEASGRVSIPDLAERLGVTAVTIREDLKHLEGKGFLTRVRGGAVVTPGQERESAIELTSMTNREEKHGIAAYAASLVKNGHTVIIDVGSTTTELAKALSPDLRDVIVITNGLNIAMSLESAPGISVIVTGGTLRPLQHSLVAPMGTLLLDRLKADIAFIGCNGVDVERGFTNANIAEAEIKQAMLKAAGYSVFLADHDKIGKVASAFVAEVHRADLLITDSRANAEILEALKENGLETVVVDSAH
jgi:DeoR family fructose operon transcriptional repressor